MTRLEDVIEHIKDEVMGTFSDCAVMISYAKDELRIFCMGDKREIVAKIIEGEE